MSIERIIAGWKSYSGRKKAAIIGAALLAVGVAGGQNQSHGQPGRSFAGAGQMAAAGMSAPGYGGAPVMAGGYAASPVNPYSAPAAMPASSDAPDLNADYEARERVNDQSARGFDQYIRDETDVQNASTGEITTDVPNDVANPEIASGSYETAAPADVAAATDGGE